MSLLNIYSSYDREREYLRKLQKEVIKIAGVPFLVYKIGEEKSETDDLYGEITYKSFNYPVEITGLIKNPELQQLLTIWGLEIPEILHLYTKINDNIEVGDVIQFYHQREQLYQVTQSVPLLKTERLQKSYHKLIVCEKFIKGRGYNFPYIWSGKDLKLWLPIREGYKTEFVLDRTNYHDWRKIRIEGNYNQFWCFCEDEYEIGYLKNSSLKINLSISIVKPFTLSLFFNPITINEGDFINLSGKKITFSNNQILFDGQYLYDITFSTNEWIFLSFIFDNNSIFYYENGELKNSIEYTKDWVVDFIYFNEFQNLNCKISNISLYNVNKSEEILNLYQFYVNKAFLK